MDIKMLIGYLLGSFIGVFGVNMVFDFLWHEPVFSDFKSMMIFALLNSAIMYFIFRKSNRRKD